MYENQKKVTIKLGKLELQNIYEHQFAGESAFYKLL